MKIFILIAVSLILLTFTGCDQAPSNKPGADGYYFEKSSFVRTEFPVKVVLFQSASDLQKEYARISKEVTVVGKPTTKNVAAFVVLNKNNTNCTIYMIDPKISYQPEFIGHELVHCIYGDWHSEPQS